MMSIATYMHSVLPALYESLSEAGMLPEYSALIP